MSGQESVLILGATSDIALAIAHSYAKQGCALLLAARHPQALADDAEDLRIRYGVAVTLFPFDALDAASHTALLSAIGEMPQTVVCAIGWLGDQPLAQKDSAHAEAIIRTNFLEPALLLDQIAARMQTRGNGTLIAISSVAGDRGRASNYYYGSAKAGFTAFLSGLRNRLAKDGVHVITVKPGFVHTRMTEGMALPALLTAEPQEIADAVLKAQARQHDVIYVRTVWRLIMFIITHLPETIFKRLSL